MINDKYTIYTDGGSRGNPGPSACAFVIHGVHQQGYYLGIGTNNNAEYMGVLKAYAYLSPIQSPPVLNFYLDSELVVKQLTGLYKIKDSNLQRIAFEIKKFQKNYSVTYTHIPRSQNIIADLLVNQTLDKIY